MAKGNCGSCSCFENDPGSHRVDYSNVVEWDGRCHLFPPSSIGIVRGFPVVKRDDYCWQHQSQKAKKGKKAKNDI